MKSKQTNKQLWVCKRYKFSEYPTQLTKLNNGTSSEWQCLNRTELKSSYINVDLTGRQERLKLSASVFSFMPWLTWKLAYNYKVKLSRERRVSRPLGPKENHFVGPSADGFIECKSAIGKIKAINVLLSREKWPPVPSLLSLLFFYLRDVWDFSGRLSVYLFNNYTKSYSQMGDFGGVYLPRSLL